MTLTSEEKNTIRELYLRPSLLGAVDGLITTFVILAAGVASNVDKKTTALIALASLLADALSMAVSEGISSRSLPNVSVKEAFLKGLVCFSSFAAFGSMPVIAFAVTPSTVASEVPSIFTFVTFLLIIGCARAYMTGENYGNSVLEVTGLGVAAGGVAYGVAKLGA